MYLTGASRIACSALLVRGISGAVRRGCRLIWLDPMPVQEDIGKAYAHYYTHSVARDARPAGGLRRLLLRMKQSYQALVYGYATDFSPSWHQVLGRTFPPLPDSRRIR